MQTNWEYRKASVMGSVEAIESELNALGADGWEVISASFNSGPHGHSRHELILKRQKIEPQKAASK